MYLYEQPEFKNKFIINKYTKWYFSIIQNALDESRKKSKDIYYEKHHILPKSIWKNYTNLNVCTWNGVLLTAKEHFLCHLLLPKMVCGKRKHQMLKALWGMTTLESSVQNRQNINSNTYSIIRNQYSTYMSINNPMKNTDNQSRRVVTWKANREKRDYIPPRILKDKFITPAGIFKTKKSIQAELNIPEHTLNTIYNGLDNLPTSNGRRSKKIDHLNIDITKTWRENGFDLIRPDTT